MENGIHLQRRCMGPMFVNFMLVYIISISKLNSITQISHAFHYFIVLFVQGLYCG